MMEISNTQECFVRLWLRLERTRRLLGGQYKRFCIRRVLKTWFGFEANDDLTSSSHLTLGHQQASLHGSRSLDDFIWEGAIRLAGMNFRCRRFTQENTANYSVPSYR